MGYYWGLELYHWGRSKVDGAPGRGSGRYPLGSGDRPYQGKPKLFNKFRKKTRVAQNPPVQKTKEEILISGSAKEVASMLRRLTNQELQYAIDRFNKEEQILNFASKEAYAKSTQKQIRDIGDKIKMTTDMIKIGTDFYNVLAKTYNATPNGQKKPLAIVGQGGGKKDDKNKN